MEQLMVVLLAVGLEKNLVGTMVTSSVGWSETMMAVLLELMMVDR